MKKITVSRKGFAFFVSPALVKVPVGMFLCDIAEPLFKPCLVNKANGGNFVIIFRSDAGGEMVVDINNRHSYI